MNLAKLYEVQAKLKERIGYKGEDKFAKMMLALLVELGECANEWRGFKYWSKNQKPRTEIQQKVIGDSEIPVWKTKNPLLEEYVDGLHFVLETGLDLGITFDKVNVFLKCENIVEQFLMIHRQCYVLMIFKDEKTYLQLVRMYLGLGEMLGFTSEQIEAAYMEKNAINHERQNSGY
jgi:dimeric dUTPase (all-alpha-NTP-PPase superfamily)